MIRTRKRAAVAAVAAVAVTGVGTGVWVATQDGAAIGGAATNVSRAAHGGPAPSSPGCDAYGPSDRNGWGMMGDRDDRGTRMGPGMTGGYLCGLTGDGQNVTSLAAAKARAQEFADRLGLRVGEVMQFTRNFYAELNTSAGAAATEVLIDPGNGAVWLEYGPAMMWNTDYGMPVHRDGSTGHAVSASEAEKIAGEWLADHRPGRTPGEAEAFPGYYTLHILEGKKITGMLSVNSATGQVWYHSWHGDFVALSDD